MAETVNVHYAKTHLSKLLERVEQGESIVIARAGRPVAELSAVKPRTDFVFGTLKGVVQYDNDTWEEDDREIAASFDDSLVEQPI